ncbi:MAG: Mu-like prophage major head subunit gpT family protein [Paracoccaceae bacterium]
MQLTTPNLAQLRVGFSLAFQGAFDEIKPQYTALATVVKSSAKSERYGWLGKMPSVREWIGDRVVQNLAEHDYTILNKDFEVTVAVDRNDIADDTLGIYGPMFTDLGQQTARHPDSLVFALLAAGFATECFDGQFFFDTDHPVLGENGAEVSVSNHGGGSGTPWFLLNTSRALKPIIYQERAPFKFVALDKETDANVFNKKQFIYGSDGRCNVGYGFWQQAYGSKQTLNAANYAAARSAMMSLKADHGKPLGIVPNLLVVPPSLEGAANKLLKNMLASGGETNEWAGTAEVLVAPLLA